MQNIFLTVVLLLMLSGIIIQIVIGVLYKNMMNEAEDMTETTNKALKSCKTKFTACYQMNKGVANVGVFVDKFISRLRIGRFKVNSMSHFSGQLMLLASLVAGIGIYLDIREGTYFFNLLPYYIICFLGLYLYFTVSGIVDIAGKRKMLKLYLVDYLENTLAMKLKEEENDKAFVRDGHMVKGQVKKERKEPEEFPFWKTNEPSKRSHIDTRELGDLLMEYLT